MKAWDGRFKEKTHPLIENFTASIGFDRILYPFDIEVNRAYAEMLERIGILNLEEKEKILNGLKEIEEELGKGTFRFSEEFEDIHMHIEKALIEKIGDVAKKLHTGKSRNDQVATDLKLYLKEELPKLEKGLLSLLSTLIERAEKEKDKMMPGYTHLQRAQIVSFGHYLLSYYFMLKRDRERLKDTIKRLDSLPLGSSALAGSTIPIDREFLKERLNFGRLSENSMDAISERDFVLDVLFSLSMIMLHLSRMAEDFIIFSTEEFSFIELPDSLCTGSSIMPQKKNPDALELIRGKASRVFGDLFALFVLLKGLPLTYNRDLQEDKEPLFNAITTTKSSISVMELCLREMSLKEEEMKKAVYESYMNATEMAEYLALKGVPFREAHKIVGKIVRTSLEKKKRLHELSLEDLKEFSPFFEEDIFDYIDPSSILKKRKTSGGSSIEEVKRKIEEEKSYIAS